MVQATLEKPQTPSTEFQSRVLAARHGDGTAYSKAVHNYETEPYQDAWTEALETLDYTAIVCPPDTYKSTTVRHFVEREIGRNPNVCILWIMNSGAQAMKQVMTVSATLEGNNVYKEAFPQIREDKRAQWTKEVLYVERTVSKPDPTLMASGINGPYQGQHFDIIILDDLTNQEDVRSPTTMDLQVNKLRGVIIDRLTEGGRIVAIFTRWGDNDLYDTYVDLGFTMIEMPVIGDYPWGPTLSPTKFSSQRVEFLRKQKGDMLFNLTFMCSTEAVEGNIIKRGDINYWDASNLPETALMAFMGVDPAASTKTRADRTAIATVVTDYRARPNIYLVDMFAGRLEVPDIENEVVKRALRTSGLRAVGLETVGFQLSLVQYLKRKHQLPVREIPYRSRRQSMHKVLGIDRDKVGRAHYLSALFTSGRLFLPKPGVLPLLDGVSLESELCSFKGVGDKMDDRLDALSFACVMAESASRPRVMVSLRT